MYTLGVICPTKYITEVVNAINSSVEWLDNLDELISVDFVLSLQDKYVREYENVIFYFIKTNKINRYKYSWDLGKGHLINKVVEGKKCRDFIDLRDV